MQLNFPWILSRKRLITAVIADGILFAFLYYALFDWRFNVLPSPSPRLAALLAFWSLSSYVVGRYASGAKRYRRGFILETFGNQLICTAFVLLLTLAITLLHILLFNPNPVQASFHSLLIPFLGLLAFFSLLLQLIISRLSEIQDQDRNSLWFYVGSDSSFQQLQELLEWTRLHVRLSHVIPEHLADVFASRYIVDQFHSLPSDVLKNLSQYQAEGSLILNRLAWCEVVLQRIPAELLSDEDLLAGCFSLPKEDSRSV